MCWCCACATRPGASARATWCSRCSRGRRRRDDRERSLCSSGSMVARGVLQATQGVLLPVIKFGLKIVRPSFAVHMRVQLLFALVRPGIAQGPGYVVENIGERGSEL